MKKIFFALLVLSLSLSSQAQGLEARSFDALSAAIDEAEFEYRETGKIFGFNSTQSCLFVSQEIAIFKNYCYPVRSYPARGYTIISREHGMIDLYEENFPPTLKRDIRITQFRSILAPYLSTRIPDVTLVGLSNLIEKMHYRYFPGCWSTNYGYNSGVAEASCSVNPETIEGIQAWADETQAIVNDETAWLELLKRIDDKLQR